MIITYLSVTIKLKTHKNANSKCTKKLTLESTPVGNIPPTGGGKMNKRKDIFEKVKHMIKKDAEIKINCSEIARQMNCDRRTVSRYIDLTKAGKVPEHRIYVQRISIILS